MPPPGIIPGGMLALMTPVPPLGLGVKLAGASGMPLVTLGAKGGPVGDRTPPRGTTVDGMDEPAGPTPQHGPLQPFICTMSRGTLWDIIWRAWKADAGGAMS